MELTHLRYFVTVAEELHFGRAAIRLHISQPPLSQQIQKLEQELGISLFNRTSRKVELTQAGRDFLVSARDILERADTSVTQMKEYADGESGHLIIGFNEPAINSFLSRSIKSFSEKYPKVRLVLKEKRATEQLDDLISRKIHIGLFRFFGFDLTGLEHKLLYSEKYVLAIHKGHRFEGRRALSLKNLKNEPLIMFPRAVNPFLYKRLRDSFERAGFSPKVVQEAVSKQTTLALVEAGLGAALVPESCRHISPPNVVYKSLKADLPKVEIYAAWRAGNSNKVIDNFLNEIRL